MTHPNPAITDNAHCVLAMRSQTDNFAGGFTVVGPFATAEDAGNWGQQNIALSDHDNPHWVVTNMTVPVLTESAELPFTVIWGNIDDGHEKRLDHVMASPDHRSVMLAAAAIALEETLYADGEVKPTPDKFLEQPHDIFAILDGHVRDSVHVSAC